MFVVGLAMHSVGVGMEHAPAGDQLMNCAPVLGLAISVIGVPGANDVPCGVCVTVPAPTTATLKFMLATKFAVAAVFAFRINVQAG